ncbi:MAG: hypothetical protein V1837_06090 [Candidatus Woesearchaeota archaeon]
MKAQTIPKGCPICSSDVKGDETHKYYCKKCNLLFEARDVHKEEKKPEVQSEVSKQQEKPKQVVQAKEAGLTASSQSNKYHKKGCRYIRQIENKNLIYYKDKKEAERQGRRPCKCNK